MHPIALIVADTAATRLGHPARLGDLLHGDNILTHTLRRAGRIEQIRRIVVVHQLGQADVIGSLIGRQHFGKPVHLLEAGPDPDGRRADARWRAARHWSPDAWRGGLGGATIFDELLPARPLAAAMREHEATAAVLVRAEWCLFDPAYAQAQLQLHLDAPEAFKLTFSQASPGLSSLVAHSEIINRLADASAAFAPGFNYQPRRPQADPIGRELNHPIPHTVRDTRHRLVYDSPRSVDLIRKVADRLGPALATADAFAIADAVRAIDRDDPLHPYRRLPQQVALELTPRRAATGPITPHHHVAFDRPDLDSGLARRIAEQLADSAAGGDVALRLGGLGDGLLHPDWHAIVRAVHEAGVASVGLDTDLLCGRDTLDRLVASPLDLITVRLNADTADTYRRVMGEDRFNQVTDNLQYLIDRRRETGWHGWIIPRLVKTADTLADMESFFERWMLIEGHAVIEPPQTGAGLMPDQNLVPMAPPRRRPCRQLARRMTVLSDGSVALCDQDWLGRAVLGDAQTTPLVDIWSRAAEVAQAHGRGDHEALPLCAACTEWHRP